MGGTIAMESAPGSGSVFKFTLPLRRGSRAGAGAPVLNLERMRIALVARPGPFQEEFARVAQRWHVRLTERRRAGRPRGREYDLGFVELHPDLARQVAALPPGGVPWRVGQTYGIVPDRPGERGAFGAAGALQPADQQAPAPRCAPRVADRNSRRAAAQARVRAFGLNVLVVEDNVVNQRLVQRLLGNLGCQSTVAATDASPWRALRGRRPRPTTWC